MKKSKKLSTPDDLRDLVIDTVIESPKRLAEELGSLPEDGVVQPPQDLLNQFLKGNNLQLDFDVLEGTVITHQGIIKLDKPTLVVKASYVERK